MVAEPCDGHDPAVLDLTEAPAVEAAAFPEGVNVEFFRPGPDSLVMRVYERGSAETLSCGTGACATFAAGRRLRLLDADVRLDLPGGTLHLGEDAAGHLIMRGPATHVFTGEAEMAAFA